MQQGGGFFGAKIASALLSSMTFAVAAAAKTSVGRYRARYLNIFYVSCECERVVNRGYLLYIYTYST